MLNKDLTFKLKLRNINVDYNTTKDMHMIAKYFRLDSFSHGTYLTFLGENDKYKGAIAIIQNEVTEYKVKPFFIDYITSKALILATVADIDNAIEGAINSSY